jgi:hypothetical protein
MGGLLDAEEPEDGRVWPVAASVVAHCEKAAGLTALTLNSISEW